MLQERDEIKGKEAQEMAEVAEVESLGTSQQLGRIADAASGDIYASPIVMVAVNGDIVGKIAAETVSNSDSDFDSLTMIA